MRVIILAAGYAVRLQPLTTETPKSLLTIGGRTIMDRILDKVRALPDVQSVHIVSNARFYAQFEAWRASSTVAGDAVIINDGTTSNENRLGAIKDIDLALGRAGCDDDALIIAGDNLFDFDLESFLAFARGHNDGVSVALYDVRDRKLASQYGVVKVNEKARVVEFQEKPVEPASTLASTGIYYFPKFKLSFIKKYVTMQSKLDAPGYYIGWLSGADTVYGFTFTEDWYDIGSIESYKKADAAYTQKERN